MRLKRQRFAVAVETTFVSMAPGTAAMVDARQKMNFGDEFLRFSKFFSNFFQGVRAGCDIPRARPAFRRATRANRRFTMSDEMTFA